MQGCGCLLALVSAIAGIFFWPLWLLTLGGIIMFTIEAKNKKKE